MEAPLITEDAVEALKMVSSEEARGLAPLQLLKEMVVRRPTKQLVFLNVLLCHTGHENNTVRLHNFTKHSRCRVHFIIRKKSIPVS